MNALEDASTKGMILRILRHFRYDAVPSEFLVYARGLPPLVRLTRLTIFVIILHLYAFDTSWDMNTSVFHDASYMPQPIVCPELQVLEIGLDGNAQRGAPVVLAPEDVAGFIATGLVFNASILDQLTFRSVQLLTTVPDAVCRLLDCAKDVVVREEPLHAPSVDPGCWIDRTPFQ
ncbi:hypothetical protein EXIGLDRAFT_758751 [Exidia glandulosa HHB12029]|uniref:Uncharacterized protein n=1 Tax=Exidia glandulosa HHB12029 TaxID=1314781 RepID=A0A165R3U4_EXIGL|nr:hypothetical protein EXIGLDRAFT_758751 [Exidia glandulosa HHB12029]